MWSSSDTSSTAQDKVNVSPEGLVVSNKGASAQVVGIDL